ncbi:MAG: saccharopine dehydrogenase family protein, partial [Flavobacteriales bacterium]
MQNKILVIGAGKSSTSLIRYLDNNAEKESWEVTVVDLELDMVREKCENHESCTPLAMDITDEEKRRAFISEHDIVISMVPARFHEPVVKDCIALKTNVITPSYSTEKMQEMDEEAKEAGILVLNELGVDPGINHMSAMKILDEIRGNGGTITCFESSTGGLVAPEYDTNPWGYKFTWNPRNVVLAGQGGAIKFKQEGKFKYIPPYQLFKRTERIHIEELGDFEEYANRDSLRYREAYGLGDEVRTIFRGTLRKPGFCKAWNIFVELGLTDDSYEIEESEDMTYREFINSYLAYNPNDSVELKLMHYLKIDQDNDIMEKLEWLGIFEHKKIGLKNATPA